MSMQKTLTVLGSTGSIGTQALDVAAFHNIRVDALAFHSDIRLGEEQVRKFKPKYVGVFDAKVATDFRNLIADTGTKLFVGEEGICEMIATAASDICLNAIGGFAGLKPTIAALNSCRRLALANKETMVAGGSLVNSLAKKTGCEILPVDSEHSAIFQCLQNGKKDEVERIILTCSGGPFFGLTKKQLEKVTKAQALGHPTWRMGQKITIDSATLMNKGLEVIEAYQLFGIPKVDVVVHRESVIHSMVEYKDHVVMAQMGVSDMRLPIQYAITYPDRLTTPSQPLDLVRVGKLSFYEPDLETFPLLGLAYKMAEKGGVAPCFLNAANEEAVGLFLTDRIAFWQIPDLVQRSCESIPHIARPTLENLVEINQFARENVHRLLK